MILKEVSYALQGCIHLIKKYSKNWNTVQYYYSAAKYFVETMILF